MTRRAAASVALTAVTALALNAAPASACSYAAPILQVGTTRVAAGATLRIAGEEIMEEDGSYPDCMPPMPPARPSDAPSVGVTAEPEPEPSSSPLVSLPPLLPVAYVAATPAKPVGVYLGNRRIATLAAESKARWKGELYRFWFADTVTIPGDLKPGRYGISAVGTVAYGSAEITVVDGLAATGAPVAGLTRLGLLSLLAGAGALAGARRVRA